MNWLKYCATQEQLNFFNEQGYLIIEDALNPSIVERLVSIVDRLDQVERQALALAAGEVMQKFRVIVEDDIFLELLDTEKVFPLAWDILGWNIQHYISHLVVSPPEKYSTPFNGAPVSGWHQDGGRPVRELERPAPRLSFKVSYWLSDTRGEDRGGMYFVPGSQKLDKCPSAEVLEKSLQVRVKPGTAVLFDRRMWHCRGKNTSEVTRKVVFIGYSYRWLRGLDYNVMPTELLAKCDPIRRQLLGDGCDVKGWWQPTEDDVPLKTWIQESRGEDFLFDASPL